MADKGILSHDEVLKLLSERAREGSISAAIALERALRAIPKSPGAFRRRARPPTQRRPVS
jgi:hypothetical protein